MRSKAIYHIPKNRRAHRALAETRVAEFTRLFYEVKNKCDIYRLSCKQYFYDKNMMLCGSTSSHVYTTEIYLSYITSKNKIISKSVYVNKIELSLCVDLIKLKACDMVNNFNTDVINILLNSNKGK